MALAIKFDGMIRNGVVANQSELAELAQVTQPRMTQIMNLLHLAPRIQEELLDLSIAQAQECSVTERELRRITAIIEWPRQRREWRRLNPASTHA